MISLNLKSISRSPLRYGFLLIRLALVAGLAIFAALWAMPGAARGQNQGDLFSTINNIGPAGCSDGAVYVYTPAGGVPSTFASGFQRPHGLVFDSAGNLFVTSSTICDTPVKGTIFKFTPGGIMSTFATGFPPNFFLNMLAVDNAGNLFVTAQNLDDPNQATTIYKITLDGTISTFASLPGQSFSLAFDGAGNLFTADGVFQLIYKFTPTGSPGVFAGPSAFTDTNQNYDPNQSPLGLAFDSNGNLYVSTESNGLEPDLILKFTPVGVKSTFATGLNYPRGLAFDSSGNLFVAEVPVATTGNILEFTSAGALYQPTPTGTPGVFASGIGRAAGNGGPEFLAFAHGPIAPPTSAVAVTFPNATAPLTTTVTSVDQNSVPPPPSNFELNGSNLTFDITTNTTPTPPIILAFTLSGDVSGLKVMHCECDTCDAQSPSSCWVDRTIDSTDPNYPSPAADNTIYASVNSLSPFMVAKFKYGAQVQQPINADGTSVFNAKRGVIPVAFKLTSDGVATCQLPPATISVFRTSGGVVGSIDESVYLLKSDSGSNFRIDSTKCQYVYNLGASSLGAGTYQVNVSIGGSVAGSATFALK